MLRLETFGSADVRNSDGESLEPLLTQPKRLALLVYLAAARPPGFHRRDHLLALFWPDSDAARARASLSQALTFLRRVLGAGVVVTRGADAIGVDRECLAWDVSEFERAIQERQWPRALALYRGNFLEALHLDDAPDVVEWVDRERDRLRALMVQAGIDQANHDREHGRGAAALAVIRAVRQFAPLDELALRVHLLIEGEAGNRAAAAVTYENYRVLLARELGMEPSSRTRSLVEAIRDGSFSSNLRRSTPG